MIYLDNAATTLVKPDLVKERLIENFDKIGNPSRGFNKISLDTGRMVLDTRIKLARLFNIKDPRRIAFTANATEALNIAISSFIGKNDHVITSLIEHNSVLRPLYLKEKEGAELSFVGLKEGKEGIFDYEMIEGLVRKNTKALVISHASNVTGNITDLSIVSDFCKKHGLLLIVDAAQSAGLIDIDVEKYGIDVLCFTGHKALYGLTGTGGIYIKEGLNPRAIKVGGSGINSFDEDHPQAMPDALEAGTINAYGILSLNASLDFLNQTGLSNIRKKEKDLLTYFDKSLREIPNLTIYGDKDLDKRVGILAINPSKISANDLAQILAEKYHIATRAGAHCAPLCHNALGTEEAGLVRFSLSYFNSKEEIDEAIKALKEILGDDYDSNNI